MVRDLGEWRPGFYSEFRYASHEHSGSACGAILKKVLVLSLIPRFLCSFFQEQVPRKCSFACAALGKEHINVNILTGPQNGLFSDVSRFHGP